MCFGDILNYLPSASEVFREHFPLMGCNGGLLDPPNRQKSRPERPIVFRGRLINIDLLDVHPVRDE